MVPSILQGLSQKPGSTLDKAIGSEADALDMKGFNAYANSMNPVATPARRQPAFRTQDLILGLLPALLGGGQQYVADYLKGKFGAADQLTQEDQAKAQEEQKRRMMLGQLQDSFYGQKADRLRQGQDRSFQVNREDKKMAEAQRMDIQNFNQQNQILDKQSANRQAEEKGRAKDRYLSQVFGTGKVRPPREAVEGMYRAQGWNVDSEGNLDPNESRMLDALYAADKAASRRLLAEKRIGELNGIKDYSKVNYAPDFEAMAKALSEYKDDPLMQHYAEAFTQKAQDAKEAYKKAQAWNVIRMNNDRKKGKYTDEQIDFLQKKIDEMPERLRVYAASVVRKAADGDDFNKLKALGTLSRSQQIRDEQTMKTIEARATSKMKFDAKPTLDELMRIPEYKAAYDSYHANKMLNESITNRIAGQVGMAPGSATPPAQGGSKWRFVK